MNPNNAFFGRIKAGLAALRARWQEHAFFYSFAALFIAVMLGVVLYWRSTADTTAAGQLAAALSAGLFTVIVIQFIWQWLSDWLSEDDAQPRELTEKVPAARLGAVFLALLIWQAAVLYFVFLLQMAVKGETSFLHSLDFWTCADSWHYLDIAEDWYLSEGSLDRLVELVFLPGYPLAVRLFYPIFHNYLYAGLFVSSLCFAGAGTVLYRLALLDMDRAAALRALRFACILPGAFFYAAPMGESLFLLLSISCIYCMRKRRWLFACLLGGLASFTRSLGLILLVPVGYELLTETILMGTTQVRARRRAAQFAALLLIPAGFAAYCLICRQVSGNAFQWSIYQREHWHQELGLFFHTAAYQTEEAIDAFREGNLHSMLGLWLPNLLCSFAALAVMLAGLRRLRTSYAAYFIAYYVVAIGPTWLLSAPRYLLVLFPIPFALAQLTRDRRADAALTVLITAAGVLYALLFTARWQVW